MGSSPAGGAENLVNEESHIDVQLDQRHMMLRGETVREKESEGGDLMEGEGGRRRAGWIQLLVTLALSLAAFQDIQDTFDCDSVVRDLVMTCGQVITLENKTPSCSLQVCFISRLSSLSSLFSLSLSLS